MEATTIRLPQFDAKDAAIYAERVRQFNRIKGPRIGDFVIFPDGEYRRFTHDWGIHGIQTTCRDSSGSFYFGGNYVSYSGALDPLIAKSDLILTTEPRNGQMWFFHHNVWRASNGVTFTVRCRVYRYEPQEREQQ